MKEKKVVIGDYVDPETGIRFVEDDRGNYHCVMNHEVKVTVEGSSLEVKRLTRIMEALRRENNWLWGVIETALQNDRKHSAGYAIRQLQKAVKERTR